ncbi:FAD-binding oxidoreductase [Altererythrobacter lutimaris]|uniref:D-lactate dehydrogenase (cytochrome) n=1 Tax=Altererythrobacter lutimaris TaxID=2743979 RepID=A0A850HIR7_9SPHN|nr:FAD-binding oxidoreductase [Altererythrobacter lutimaris]NVE95652.1 FAD-binding oxidoreductase [Altererythrobacter lutimaris]
MATLATDNPLAPIRSAVDEAALLTDADNLALYSHDVLSRGSEPVAVFRPSSVEELAAGVGAATKAGLAIVPRGGGMSYTSGYLYEGGPFLLIDTGALNAVLDINETDMTVTVEAGCTWDKLYRELKPRGLRVLAWGTLSGIRAAIGGGMSQNGIFWGARNGTAVDSALSMDVVLADGTVVSTGSEFFRPFGPDLTGLFAADCGALGVKARVTLKLVREATAFAYGSFSFDTHEALYASMSEIARAELASESFAFDPFLQAQRMKRDTLLKDAQQLGNMMKEQVKSGGVLKAMKEGAKVAMAGRSFLDDVPFSLHCVAEGRHQAAVDADMKAIEAIVTGNGGKVIENSIPKILRANPFPPPNSMLGPDGERWVPVHGFLPHSKLVECWDRLQALWDEHAEDMARLKVETGALIAATSRTSCLIEPVFFWPGEHNPFHKLAVEPDHMAKLQEQPDNPEANALVMELRRKVIDIFHARGAIHLQIARSYPLKESHQPEAWNILAALKHQVDPRGLMNPGSLGL